MVGRLALPYNNLQQWLVGWHSLITTWSAGTPLKQLAAMVGQLALPSLGMRGGIACTGESLRSWTLYMQLQTPSIHVPPLPLPDGQWHIVWCHRLFRKYQEWIDSPLVEEETLYLKGGCTGPKGNYHTEGKGQGNITGM